MNTKAHPVAPTSGMPTILIVDDEAPMRRAILRALDDAPYRFLQAASGEEALEILGKEKVHVVLSDHNMPGMSGLDLLRMIRLRHSEVVRMICTANHDFETAVRAINLGEVSRFISKPWDDEELRCSVRIAFETAAVEREVRQLRTQARRQLSELRDLEKRYPGIGSVTRDRDGAILVIELEGEDRLTCEALWKDEP
jgi:two-component system probable response regulator PhcQ